MFRFLLLERYNWIVVSGDQAAICYSLVTPEQKDINTIHYFVKKMTQLTDMVMDEYRLLADESFGESQVFMGTMEVAGLVADEIASSVFTKELISIQPSDVKICNGDFYKAQLYQHGEEATKFLGVYFEKGNPTVAHFETNDPDYVNSHRNIGWSVTRYYDT